MRKCRSSISIAVILRRIGQTETQCYDQVAWCDMGRLRQPRSDALAVHDEHRDLLAGAGPYRAGRDRPVRRGQCRGPGCGGGLDGSLGELTPADRSPTGVAPATAWRPGLRPPVASCDL